MIVAFRSEVSSDHSVASQAFSHFHW